MASQGKNRKNEGYSKEAKGNGTRFERGTKETLKKTIETPIRKREGTQEP